MRIGILGGTFNPIHNGHIYMGQSAVSELNLDKIIYIPSGVSYMKNPNEILPGKIRLEMVKLAIKNYQEFSYSDIEILRSGPSYSFDTIRTIKNEFPDWELYFIVGADTAYSIEKWYKTKELLSLCNLVVVYRKGQSIDDLKNQTKILTEKYNSKVILLSASGIDISSTEIREYIKDNISVDSYLPKEVINFIKLNHFYY